VIPEDIRQTLDPRDDTEAQLISSMEQERERLQLAAALKPTIEKKDETSKRGLVGIKSRYEEDVHINGHISVWGSYWHPEFGWGFQCCYSFDKRTPKCRGEEGKVETIKREYELELKNKALQEEIERKRVEE
jgi:hypothetical protein